MLTHCCLQDLEEVALFLKCLSEALPAVAQAARPAQQLPAPRQHVASSSAGGASGGGARRREQGGEEEEEEEVEVLPQPKRRKPEPTDDVIVVD